VGRVASVRPLWGIEGGRVTLEGDGFPIDPVAPHVRVGTKAARLASASSTALAVLIPEGLEGGSTSVRIDELPGETAFVEIGTPLVTGVHHVDSPAYDRHGNLYVTFSGSRGQQAPVSIFIVRQDGTREPFVSDVPNPTSLTFDREGRLYVSSRFDGCVYRVEADGRASLYASDLGVACGLAFGPGGALFVGDRSGSILRVEPDGRAGVFASLPASVAAFHLAFGPDGHLYVAAPTLGTHDPIYRISPEGEAVAWSAGTRVRRRGTPLCRGCARRIERSLPHPPRRSALTRADARRRTADRPGFRSARRRRARDERNGLPPRRAAARAAAVVLVSEGLRPRSPRQRRSLAPHQCTGHL
jgi:hypothetical protein